MSWSIMHYDMNASVALLHVFAGERGFINQRKFWSINGKGRIYLPCPRVDATL
jgi:hypothetical protein